MNLKYAEEVSSLGLANDQYAIFGSGPMVAVGLRENDDIDVIVKPETWEELAKKYHLTKPNLIELGHMRIYKDWLPWFSDVNLLINEAEVINGLNFVKLERVLEWKKVYGREKDLADVKIIEDYLTQKAQQII